jgi:predicted ATPase/DNA-binding SARP family transcriptional activator
MARLEISLLGQLRVVREGRPVDDLAYAKVRALLAYLAVEADRPQRRETLAALLWPDHPEKDARHGLSQALTTLRHAIGDPTAAPPYLIVTRDAVGFNRASDQWVDADVFAALLEACDRHAHRQPAVCAACAERLVRATTLYRGDFLAGFSLAASEEFEDWVRLQRERLRRRCLDGLGHLGAYHEKRGAYEQARVAVVRQLELDPWREPAHRQLMRLLWLSGDRAAALAQYERCRHLLADELGVDPEPETTALYHDIRTAQAGTRVAGPLRPSSGRPQNLPESPTPLLGRARELEDIADLLAVSACRLLTLVGPGGIGKTRLAVEAARDQVALFADGVSFVSLAPVGAAAFLVPAIAQTLGITLHDRADPVDRLVDRVRDREMLLVLDNFEHLIDGASLLSRIIGSAPALKMLVTSRERLNLQGEWVFAVGGLGVPKGDDTDGFEGYGAVQLFVQSLRRTRSQAPLQPEERPWVVRICRLVEGMPLAIELAAGWASVLSLPEIGHEMERDLGFLATSLRDVPPEHRSMRAVFDRSWNLLADEERAVFRRLSVFRGGFLRPAAELAGASLPILSTLVAKSFLRTSPAGRYDIHELLPQYGAEKLAEDPREDREAHDRHCAYYLDFVARRETALMGHHQDKALDEIDAEIDNVRAAWRWGTAEGRAGEIARAARGLWLLDLTRGRCWEGAETFDRAMAALEDTNGDVGLPNPDRVVALGMALLHRGGHRCRLGLFDQARDLLARGVALLRGLEAPWELGLALNLLATTAHARGRYVEEQEMLQESLALFRAAGDDWGAAYSLNDLAMVAHLQGDDALAQRLCQDSLTLSSRTGDRRAQAFARHNLGVIAAHLERYEDAAREHRASLALRRADGDQWGISVSLIQLGGLARQTGARDEAEGCLLIALRIAMEARVLPVALEALIELAALAADEGRPDRARAILAPVIAHPALNHSGRDHAERLFAEVDRQIPAGAGPTLSGQRPDAALTVEALADALLRETASSSAAPRAAGWRLAGDGPGRP